MKTHFIRKEINMSKNSHSSEILKISWSTSSKMDDKRSCDAGGGSEVHMRLNKTLTKQLSWNQRPRGPPTISWPTCRERPQGPPIIPQPTWRERTQGRATIPWLICQESAINKGLSILLSLSSFSSITKILSCQNSQRSHYSQGSLNIEKSQTSQPTLNKLNMSLNMSLSISLNNLLCRNSM